MAFFLGFSFVVGLQLYPVLSFVFLYSFLAHKELRFIYPILPLLACIAGLGLWKIDEARREAALKAAEARVAPAAGRSGLASCSLPALLYRGAQFALLASFGVTALSLHVSSLNYPGGHALHRLHTLLHPLTSPDAAALPGPPPTVHICNLAATTGASRFGERTGRLSYSKAEGLDEERLRREGFDFLVFEARAADGARPPRLEGYVPVEEEATAKQQQQGQEQQQSAALVRAFDRLRFPTRSFPFFAVEQRPALWLLRRDASWVDPHASVEEHPV